MVNISAMLLAMGVPVAPLATALAVVPWDASLELPPRSRQRLALTDPSRPALTSRLLQALQALQDRVLRDRTQAWRLRLARKDLALACGRRSPSPPRSDRAAANLYRTRRSASRRRCTVRAVCVCLLLLSGRRLLNASGRRLFNKKVRRINAQAARACVAWARATVWSSTRPSSP